MRMHLQDATSVGPARRPRSHPAPRKRTDETARFEALVEHASDLILVVGLDGVLTYASPATHTFFGLDAGMLGRQWVSLVFVPGDSEVLWRAWRQVTATSGASTEVQVRAVRSDGRRRTLRVTLTNAVHVPQLAGVVCNARDVTDELNLRARYEDHLVRDGLTGLANRPALLHELQSRTANPVGPPVVLALVDVVGMAGLNDRVGYIGGDLLLRTLAARLSRVAGPGAYVARTSGDEFAVVATGDQQHAIAVGRRLVSVTDAPYELPGGGSASLHVRVGVASSRQGDGTVGGLLQDADLALADVETGEDPPVRLCNDALRERRRRRLTIEVDLAHPDLLEQLSVVYQPIVDLVTGQARGAEALVRWQHPELGPVGPAEFVPVAERTGAIARVGAHVLRVACEQRAAWDATGLLPGGYMAVNLSARQLLDPGLPALVATVLAETGLPADRLCLEVTETALVDESEVTADTVEALLALGTKIHVDDFGTGYSSFSQLRRFRFHGLKIDRSFVTGLGEHETSRIIVGGIVSIARALGLHVTAEGVEEERQRRLLTELGCDTGQGYLWSRPLPADEVVRVVAGTSRVIGEHTVADRGRQVLVGLDRRR